MENFI